jgi:molybdopterin converting factor small subunit
MSPAADRAKEAAGLKVLIPGLLRSYTDGAETVMLPAHATLDEALRDLNARFPGLRFRVVDEQDAIRPHIKMFVDGELARRLDMPVADAKELMIVGALSGG